MAQGKPLKRHAGLIVISLLFFTAGIFRLNDLSLLNPDSSRYLIWGNSIASGEGFVDSTQPEPDRYVVHAPLYPLLISPVELFFPLSVIAVKVWTLLWGIAAIIIFYFLMVRLAGEKAALVGTIILACNPLILIYSTEVLSDAPFIATVLLVFLLSDKHLKAGTLTTPQKASIVASVAAVALLREVGVSIVAASVVYYYFIRQRPAAWGIALASGALLGIWYLRNHVWIGAIPPSQGGNMMLITQHFVTPPESPLINELALRLWHKLGEYSYQLYGMLIYPLFMAKQFRLDVDPSAFHQWMAIFMKSYGKFIVLFITVPAILWGLYADMKKSKSSVLRLLFGGSYLVLVLLYPVHDIRFLLPLLPLMIYYLVSGARRFAGSLNLHDKLKISGLSTVIFILMLPNLSGIYEILKINTAYRASPERFYERVRRLPAYPLMFTQPWSLLGRWVRENIPDTAVLASPSKELSVVVGNRKVVELDQSSALPTFETLLRDNGVDYVLTTIRREGFNVFEFFMGESKRYAFEPAFSIANLHLMRVRSRLREHLPADTASVSVADSNDATYLLREGRAELMDERYESAAELFSKALERDSTLPEIYYQTVIAYSMAGDSDRAKYYYQKLFTLPQALGYVGNARMQIAAMQFLKKARGETFPSNFAVEAYNVASLYWKLGYPRRAAGIMNVMLDVDTTYFSGLLWGLHFNLQNGDLDFARKYLGILKNLDEKNPVVAAFMEIIGMVDSLEIALLPEEKGRLHHKMSVLYKQIELNEEALDHAEMALREDPGNAEAYLTMAQIFERKSNLRMALRNYGKALALGPANGSAAEMADSIRNILSGQR